MSVILERIDFYRPSLIEQPLHCRPLVSLANRAVYEEPSNFWPGVVAKCRRILTLLPIEPNIMQLEIYFLNSLYCI